jgi:hypothetical protein
VGGGYTAPAYWILWRSLAGRTILLEKAVRTTPVKTSFYSPAAALPKDPDSPADRPPADREYRTMMADILRAETAEVLTRSRQLQAYSEVVRLQASHLRQRAARLREQLWPGGTR